MAKIKEKGTQYCVYPFCGHFDGDGHTISGLKIGSAEKASQDPRMSFAAGLFGVVNGDFSGNDLPDESVRRVTLSGINLKEITINVRSTYQNYTGGLVGSGQNGFEIDKCSVTGSVCCYAKESFARAGGIAGSLLRGKVTNTSADVNVSVDTDASNAYGGGFTGMDNRVTFVNCYEKGNVTGNAGTNNKVHVGGFTGQAGAAYYNCYAYGDVVSEKTTQDVGGFAGRLAGISIAVKCYYNSDAKQATAGTDAEKAEAVGVDVTDDEKCADIQAKTKDELASEDFAKLLNANREAVEEGMKTIDDLLSTKSLTMARYFTGGVSDLTEWKSDGGIAVLIAKAGGGSGSETTDKPGSDDSSGGSKTSGKTLKSSLKTAKGQKIAVNAGKKTLTLTFAKIKAATQYRIAYKKSGAKKWSYKWTASPKFTWKKLKKGTCAQIRVLSYKAKNGNTYLFKKPSTNAVLMDNAVLRSVRAGKKSAVVKWTKVSKVKWQIFYAKNKTFKGAKKTVAAKWLKKGKTIKKLTKKKKYYFRIRAYKKIGSVTYYGAYSRVKSVKIK